jgi:hypothetical protein
MSSMPLGHRLRHAACGELVLERLEGLCWYRTVTTAGSLLWVLVSTALGG